MPTYLYICLSLNYKIYIIKDKLMLYVFKSFETFFSTIVQSLHMINAFCIEANLGRQCFPFSDMNRYKPTYSIFFDI